MAKNKYRQPENNKTGDKMEVGDKIVPEETEQLEGEEGQVKQTETEEQTGLVDDAGLVPAEEEVEVEKEDTETEESAGPNEIDPEINDGEITPPASSTEIEDALNAGAMINENTAATGEVLLDPETDPEAGDTIKEEIEYDAFNRQTLISILDEVVDVDDSQATIYNTVDDMEAAAKLEKIYKVVAKDDVNNPIAKIISQALKFAKTSADSRKGDMLYSTIMREINESQSGKDFDLLMFTIIKISNSLRTFNEMSIIRSFRGNKNVELVSSAQVLSHLLCQLATVEDRKKKIGVSISLDRAVTMSTSGLNENGVTLVKKYFSK